MKVKFRDWNCEIQFDKYANGGGVAIELVDASDGEPVATATVNLEGTRPGRVVPDGHVAIKNYSENEGMLECLMKAGIVSEPVEHIVTGWVTVPVCKLLKGGE